MYKNYHLLLSNFVTSSNSVVIVEIQKYLLLLMSST